MSRIILINGVPRYDLTTDNLGTVYPIMRADAFDPSGRQGLLFDLTLMDTLVCPSKDKGPFMAACTRSFEGTSRTS